MTLACFHKTKLHTTLLSLFLMFAFFSHAKIVGTPPYKSIDIPVSEVSSHFDMVIDMDNSLFISYEDGVKVFNGSQWQNLDFSKGNGIRRLLVDNDRVYLGGHQTIGYIEKDVFGQYNFTNMTPKNQEFESIWDIIKCTKRYDQ